MLHGRTSLQRVLTSKLNEKQKEIVISPMYKLLNQLKSGSISASEVFESCQTQKRNSSWLNCYIPESVETSDYYSNTLKQLDSTSSNDFKPLHGIPFGIKDNFCCSEINGEKTTAGSNMLKDFVSPYNATVVDRIVKNGGIMMGKTALDEFGMGSTTSHSPITPPTSNPWSLILDNIPKNEILSAGGSSGGSAAAVASYSVFGALGSDTGGSVRQPASWNGIVGLKPSYGTLSRFGLIAYGSSLDCPGIFTRNITDCSLILDNLSGQDVNDNNTFGNSTLLSSKNTLKIANNEISSFNELNNGEKKIRVGIPSEYWVKELSNEIVDTWKKTADIMEQAGAEIVECSLPHTKYALPVYLIIANAEASSNLARYDGVRYGYRADNYSTVSELVKFARDGSLGNEVKRRIMMGTFALSRDSYSVFFQKAQLVRRLIKEDFDKCFENVDVLLTPTAPSTAKTISECLDNTDPVIEYLNDLMTIPANLAGIPALSMPVGLSTSNLPVGMQLMGNFGDDAKLLEIAAILEQKLQD